MNRHPKEVKEFMLKNEGGAPSKPRVLAKFENKYGEEKIIHLTRSGLRVKNNSSTVCLTLNKRVAELTSAKIKARRLHLKMSLEDLCIRAGIASVSPKSRMWEIENNISKNGLRFGTLYALAIAMKCEIVDLLPTTAEVLAGANIKTVAEKTLKVTM